MTDFVTAPDGVRIAYEVLGEGEPIILVHGFGSSRIINWGAPGWCDTLTRAGHRVVALDCRGHGDSDKPHEVAAYDPARMTGDIALVMDAAGTPRAAVMGYSMGGSLTLRLAYEHPERVSRAVIGGVGEVYFSRDQAWRDAIAEALTTSDTSALTPVQWMFRDFAMKPGKDVIALAACMSAPKHHLSREQLATISMPTLIVCGEKDTVSGAPEPLAEALCNARAVVVPNRDHMLTVGDRLYKAAVLDFLEQS